MYMSLTAQIGIGVIICGLIGLSGFLFQQNRVLVATVQQERSASVQRNASSTQAVFTLEATVTTLEEEMAELEEELSDTESDLRKEKNRNEDFAEQIEDLTGAVGLLDRLAKTDKELLAKYSRTYFLNENYVPKPLTQIPSTYVLAGKKDQYFHGNAAEYLVDMLKDAKDEGLDLKIVSAYRSFDEQRDVKSSFTQVYGTGANTFSADQGYSEHQLGTAVDLSDPTTGGAFLPFATTKEYQWLQKNAYKYGFILSYPEGNNFYIYEPWHWRFVGRDLARDLNRANAQFYEWEQREIDEYLVTLFD